MVSLCCLPLQSKSEVPGSNIDYPFDFSCSMYRCVLQFNQNEDPEARAVRSIRRIAYYPFLAYFEVSATWISSR